MATQSPNQQELRDLRKENRRLMEENQRLSDKVVATSQDGHTGKGGLPRRFIRTSVVAMSIIAAVLLLFVGNMLFWAGNTVVKTDRYVETVQPLIHNPVIQTAIANYSAQQFFAAYDVEKFTEEVLPPRAAFLAPSIAGQLQKYTDDAIQKLLARPQFQERWNTANANAHAKFIASVQRHGSDGVISLNEFYQQISQQLKGTKLAFLAGKPLPAKVGSIQLVQGKWLSALETVINNIDTWRTIALLLLLAASFIGVWVSRNRRRTVTMLGLLFAASMFITLIIQRVAQEVIAGKVDSQYAEAARQAAQTVFHPLAVQTATILVFGLLVAFVAWVSGPSRNAARFTDKVHSLLNGKLHGAIFSKENGLTLFFGRHKRVLQWAVIGVILLLFLFIRLTPMVLLLSALSALVLVLLIEALSATQPSSTRSNR